MNVGCEWAVNGIEASEHADVLIIVDVLSFTTCVEVAVSRGATVFPYRWRDQTAAAYAEQLSATLAVPRNQGGPDRRDPAFSLSPASLMSADAGLRLVLPSPNGSTLAFAAKGRSSIVVAGCLRNAAAVARFARDRGTSIGLIPAGERWADGSLRPALEDWLGVGAIASELCGTGSPEARAAEAAFVDAQDSLTERIEHCPSGRELIERGYREDVEIATALNVSDVVPILVNAAFTDVRGGVP